MPNVKIFVDQHVFDTRRVEITEMLVPLRERLCLELSVPKAACQFAVVPVLGLPDQPLANMELQYLAKPDRTPEKITAACAAFRKIVEAAVGSCPAVRATTLDPETYIALK